MGGECNGRPVDLGSPDFYTGFGLFQGDYCNPKMAVSAEEGGEIIDTRSLPAGVRAIVAA
jgi:hypothetical protein